MQHTTAEVDARLAALEALHAALVADPPPGWPQILDLASGVLGGAPIWWRGDESAAWSRAGGAEGTPPPEAVAETRNGATLAAVDPVPGLVPQVWFALYSRARHDASAHALDTAAARYRALRDISFEGICVHRNGVILEVNQALADLYGYTRDEMIGMDMTRTVDPEVFPRVMQLVRDGFQGAYETSALRKDGSTLPLEARGKDYLFDDQPVRVASFRDIRERKAAEAALHQARQTAERASQQKSAFLGNMSHELRTPMNAVLGLVQLLSLSALSEDQRVLVDQLYASSSDLLALLDDLLDLTRIEEGRLQLHERSFHLPTLVDAARRGMRAPRVGVVLEVDIDGIPEWWHGDDLRIRQILVNLLDNAAKFTQTGRIHLGAHTDGGGLTLSVRDTGIGIAPDKLPLLFKRFERGDAEANHAYGGSGLGLHISHELAERMGGRLTAVSTLGEGSTFALHLPLQPTAPTDAHERPTPERASSLSVLLVEDNPVNQLVVQRLLESLDHEVTVVSDGAQAVDTCAHTSFDVVLMDVQMPVMDGLDATRHLRQAGYTGPIVALTAHAMREDLDRCIDAGMDAWITKPVQLDGLARTLRNLVDDRS